MDRLSNLPSDIFRKIITKLNAAEATRSKLLNKTIKAAVDDSFFRNFYNKNMYDGTIWLFVHKFDADSAQTGKLLGFTGDDFTRISVSLHPLAMYLNPGDEITLECAARSIFVFSKVRGDSVSFLVLNISGPVCEVVCPDPINKYSIEVRESTKVLVDDDGIGFRIIHVVNRHNILYCEYQSVNSEWVIDEATLSPHLDPTDERGMILTRDPDEGFLVSFLGDGGPYYISRPKTELVGPAVQGFRDAINHADMYPHDNSNVNVTSYHSVGNDGFFVHVIRHVNPVNDQATRIRRIGLARMDANWNAYHHLYAFHDNWLQNFPFQQEGEGFHVAKLNQTVYIATKVGVGVNLSSLLLHQFDIPGILQQVRLTPPFSAQRIGRVVSTCNMTI